MADIAVVPLRDFLVLENWLNSIHSVHEGWPPRVARPGHHFLRGAAWKCWSLARELAPKRFRPAALRLKDAGDAGRLLGTPVEAIRDPSDPL
jgi:hypothetical protein